MSRQQSGKREDSNAKINDEAVQIPWTNSAAWRLLIHATALCYLIQGSDVQRVIRSKVLHTLALCVYVLQRVRLPLWLTTDQKERTDGLPQTAPWQRALLVFAVVGLALVGSFFVDSSMALLLCAAKLPFKLHDIDTDQTKLKELLQNASPLQRALLVFAVVGLARVGIFFVDSFAWLMEYVLFWLFSWNTVVAVCSAFFVLRFKESRRSQELYNVHLVDASKELEDAPKWLQRDHEVWLEYRLKRGKNSVPVSSKLLQHSATVRAFDNEEPRKGTSSKKDTVDASDPSELIMQWLQFAWSSMYLIALAICGVCWSVAAGAFWMRWAALAVLKFFKQQSPSIYCLGMGVLSGVMAAVSLRRYRNWQTAHKLKDLQQAPRNSSSFSEELKKLPKWPWPHPTPDGHVSWPWQVAPARELVLELVLRATESMTKEELQAAIKGMPFEEDPTILGIDASGKMNLGRYNRLTGGEKDLYKEDSDLRKNAVRRTITSLDSSHFRAFHARNF